MRVTIPILVSVVAAAAAVAGAQTPPATGVAINPVVLTVNGEQVHAGAVRLAMQNMAGQMRRQGQKPDQQQLLQAATQQVIDTKLLAQEARRRDVKTDTAKAGQILENIEKQAGGRDALVSSLGQAGITYDELQAAVHDSELALGLVDRDIRPKVTVSDEELQSFYADNPKMFERPEQVHARHILIKVADDATPEQDAAARKRAEDARARALAGEDFATLAKELSEGPSAESGGDLGFFGKDQMVEPFASTAFELKPGDISDVVKTRFGYHVIKVEEKRPASTETFDEVKEPLRNALVNQKVGDEVGKLVQSLREKAEITEIGAKEEAATPATGETSPKAEAPGASD